MIQLRYEPGCPRRVNVYDAALDARGLIEVRAWARVTDVSALHLLEFRCTRHTRGVLRHPGTLLISCSSDGSRWVVEPHRHRQDMPLLTLVLNEFPVAIFDDPTPSAA